MKYFLIKLFIILTLINLITFGLKYFLPYQKNYNSAMVDKLKILHNNKEKRKIVLIGGSSVGWGLSAEQIQKATNITTINIGHHAGFGLLDFQDFVISCINPNDIVIFSPEWHFYDKPNFYDTATLEDLYKNIEYLKITNKTIFTKIKSICLRRISFSNHKEQLQSNPYIYNCLNNYGDVISNCIVKPGETRLYNICFDNFNMSEFLNTFKYTSKAKCIFLFPPTQKSIYDKNKKSFENLQKAISNSNLDYIDRITDNVYSENDFFDAEYHLKCDIKRNRTQKVIKHLLINYPTSN